MELDTCIIRTNHAFAIPIQNELTMFDTEAGKFYGFNEVATAVWNHLADVMTVEHLCQRLVDEFDISTEICKVELLEFLVKMELLGLIQIRR